MIEVPNEVVKTQGDEAWFEARRGKVTASIFHKVFHGGVKGWISLMDKIENGDKFYGNAATRWGEDNEPKAIAMFQLLQGLQVHHTGFVLHPDNPQIGASPDGLIGQNLGVECKCPYKPENHTTTLLSREVPRHYVAQVQGSMMVTGRDSWYFISFDPRRPDPGERLVVILVPADLDYQARLYARLLQFLECYNGDRNPEPYFTSSVAADGELPKLF